MYPMIDWPRALLRGRYMMAVSRMQDVGVPIDVLTLKKMQAKWDLIQDELIAGIDHQYGVFEGRTFRIARWADYLERHQIPWPRLASGELDLKDETFRAMAKAYPQLAAMRELRSALSELRLSDLRVGDDGRNRCLLSPFRSKTGRNQPSNTRFIFGPSVWLRSLIQPRPGWAVAYIDYCQQEFGIAAALSGDQAMMDAYRSGDPYLAFAKQAGAVPADATKATHKSQRELFKQCVLAVQYGMGAESLAEKIGQPVITARWLLDLHRSTYREFWRWSDASLDEFSLHGRLWTTLGWELRAAGVVNPRSVRNFPMQANGAEILRLACIYLTEAGIRVCAPVHDAVLIEAQVDALDATVNRASALMIEASSQVLGGFPLACDVNVIRHPDRYIDERGRAMWDTVIGLVGAEQH
jgi:DNA polymerase-1